MLFSVTLPLVNWSSEGLGYPVKGSFINLSVVVDAAYPKLSCICDIEWKVSCSPLIVSAFN